jgi:hypothetical protein
MVDMTAGSRTDILAQLELGQTDRAAFSLGWRGLQFHVS